MRRKVSSERMALDELHISYLNLAQQNSNMLKAKSRETSQEAARMIQEAQTKDQEAAHFGSSALVVVAEASRKMAKSLGVEIGANQEVHLITDVDGLVIAAELVTMQESKQEPSPQTEEASKKTTPNQSARASAPQIDLPDGVDLSDAMKRPTVADEVKDICEVAIEEGEPRQL